jgi:hypothetical protein
MKRFIYGLTLAAGMVLATSCADKLDELLENPNAVNATTASPDFLLNSIQLNYQSLWYGVSDRGARLTRQINQGSALYESGYAAGATNGTWSNAYASILADVNFLLPLAKEVLLENPGKVAEYRTGKKGLLGFFMSELMKKSQGKADPKVATQLITELLAN